jgi:ribosomal protein L24E
MSSSKKLVINGKEEQPIKKKRVPRNVDWQAIAKKKTEEQR